MKLLLEDTYYMMQTIEVRVQVGSDHTLSLQLPEGVPVGDYQIVLVLNQQNSENETESEATQPDVLQEIRALLKPSVAPGHSLADELIQERRAALEHE